PQPGAAAAHGHHRSERLAARHRVADAVARPGAGAVGRPPAAGATRDAPEPGGTDGAPAVAAAARPDAGHAVAPAAGGVAREVAFEPAEHIERVNPRRELRGAGQRGEDVGAELAEDAGAAGAGERRGAREPGLGGALLHLEAAGRRGRL